MQDNDKPIKIPAMGIQRDLLVEFTFRQRMVYDVLGIGDTEYAVPYECYNCRLGLFVNYPKPHDKEYLAPGEPVVYRLKGVVWCPGLSAFTDVPPMVFPAPLPALLNGVGVGGSDAGPSTPSRRSEPFPLISPLASTSSQMSDGGSTGSGSRCKRKRGAQDGRSRMEVKKICGKGKGRVIEIESSDEDVSWEFLETEDSEVEAQI